MEILIPITDTILNFMLHCTLYNCTSIDLSRFLNADDVGDVVSVAVAVATGDGLAAAGD